MKILVITTCAPFVGEKDLIQRKALKSWKDVDVIVLGNDRGAAEICKELGFLHIPNIPTAHDELKLNHYGMMLDKGLKAVVPYVEAYEVIIWANSDLIIESIAQPVSQLYKTYGDFVGWCRRWDCDWTDIKNIDTTKITEHPYCGIDVFIWTKTLFKKQVQDIPNFVVDAWQTDHYFKEYMGTLQTNYFELTYILKAIHLNHGSGCQLKGDWNIAAKHNRELHLNCKFKNIQKPIILRKVSE